MATGPIIVGEGGGALNAVLYLPHHQVAVGCPAPPQGVVGLVLKLRVAALDASNVTEDADAGVRLARAGWRSRTIASVTWEEAPTTLRTWLWQRRRWIAGHVVTAIVHLRNPVQTWRDLGPAGYCAHNTTEDADLAVRMARLGHRSAFIPSATFEEAPVTLRAFLHQRRRWIAGHIITAVVHLRNPVETWRQIGPAGSLALLAQLPVATLSTAAHPLGFALFAQGELHGALGAVLALGYGASRRACLGHVAEPMGGVHAAGLLVPPRRGAGVGPA